MKVKCKFCKFEKDGVCLKKKGGAGLSKVKLNKPRSCSLYTEEAIKVISDYRKKEKHKKVLQAQEQRNAKIREIIRQQKVADEKKNKMTNLMLDKGNTND